MACLDKFFLASAPITGLFAVAAQDLAPKISYAKLFADAFLGFAALAVNLVGLSVIYLNVCQWVLRSLVSKDISPKFYNLKSVDGNCIVARFGQSGD